MSKDCPPGDPAAPECLLELFAAFRPRLVTEPLTDFSRLHLSTSSFCEVAPVSVDEVAGLVLLARQHNIPLRVRGQGHALNGSNLPQPGELVLQTRRLSWVRYEELGTVTAGAGIGLWTLRDLLNAEQFTLPVVNDGFSGPSVGGFIAAGGFGPGSASYGGFWENVAELVIAAAHGLLRVKRGDPLFPWLFGSMGQLGLVVESKLDLVPAGPGASPRYPDGLSISCDDLGRASLGASGPPPEESGTRLYWFTLFVPESRLEEARAHLGRLEAKHAGVFQYRERYCYLIHGRGRVVPSLVYPEAHSFFAIGIWGFHEDGTPTGIESLNSFEADFMQLALEQGFRRYLQSELSGGPDSYRRYFAPAILTRFLEPQARCQPTVHLQPRLGISPPPCGVAAEGMPFGSAIRLPGMPACPQQI